MEQRLQEAQEWAGQGMLTGRSTCPGCPGCVFPAGKQLQSSFQQAVLTSKSNCPSAAGSSAEARSHSSTSTRCATCIAEKRLDRK